MWNAAGTKTIESRTKIDNDCNRSGDVVRLASAGTPKMCSNAIANSLCIKNTSDATRKKNRSNNGFAREEEASSEKKQQLVMLLFVVVGWFGSFLRSVMTVTLFFHHKRCNTHSKFERRLKKKPPSEIHIMVMQTTPR